MTVDKDQHADIISADFPVRHHNWVDGQERRIPACETVDGNDRTEKTCAACALVKVTIHYPDGSIPGREWITASGAKWEGTATPPCIPKGVVEGVDDPPREVPFT